MRLGPGDLENKVWPDNADDYDYQNYGYVGFAGFATEYLNIRAIVYFLFFRFFNGSSFTCLIIFLRHGHKLCSLSYISYYCN